MNIIISGSYGFIGSALAVELAASGHRIVRMVRGVNVRQPGSIVWNPAGGELEISQLEATHVIIHLAGESIAGGRWTAAKKEAILQSRVKGTRLLSQAIARLKKKPLVFISASAVGFYGSRGDEVLDENSLAGTGFLADVCRGWETAADAAREAGVRVVHPRFGMVLSAQGGALPKMLTPFRLGVGGVIGDGAQYMSWITLNDAVRALVFAVNTIGLQGPLNLVSPHPLTNREFTKTLGVALHRPTLFPLPAFAARLAFGEMADSVLLGSCRAQPQRLLAAGFQFQQAELGPALRFVLNEKNKK